MPSKDFLEDKQQVTLYPTKSQHKKLKELAAKRGKNLSTYILDSAFRDEKIHEKLDKIMGMLEGNFKIEAKCIIPQDASAKMNAIKGLIDSEVIPPETITEAMKPSIKSLKETVKQMETKKFRSFPKGGK